MIPNAKDLEEIRWLASLPGNGSIYFDHVPMLLLALDEAVAERDHYRQQYEVGARVFRMRDEALGKATAELSEAVRERNELRKVLYEVEAYLEDRADVVDGPYGEPASNQEMRLLIEVRTALKETPHHQHVFNPYTARCECGAYDPDRRA